MQKRNTQHLTSFDQIFENQVEKTPEAIAVFCNGQELTYAELNQRANQLANYLKDLGVKPEVLVGLYVERSIDIAVGILGIMKAGGAYVPIDPKYPQERSAFILEETEVSLVLTQEHLIRELPDGKMTKICLDSDWGKIARMSSENPEPTENLENLAYIIYTSGSTGKPKGVQITHANIGYYLEAISQVIPITEKDVYLHTASIAFSSSVRHLMLPLSQGAKVVIATREHLQNPLALFQLIEKVQATVFDTVASVWRYGIQALNSLETEERNLIRRSHLKTLVFSGGLLPCRLLKQVREQFEQPPQIFNIYGQTETLGVCAHSVPQNFNQDQGYVPVGVLYPHNKSYILDENLQAVPIGESGELCIVGTNLSRGYWQRPQENATKFIDNPFNPETPERLFRTGDVARQLPDGNLEILGRTDFQVKIRGMRVELDEIAALLEQHPHVKEAVLKAYEDRVGENRLVAYIVPKDMEVTLEEATIHNQLRHFLHDKLPDYMVPAYFINLPALPLTPNGKLDRLALPKPSFLENEQIDGEFSADTEIQKLFCETLNLRQVKPQDNFISLGGNSLSYVQVSMKLERYLGYLPPKWEEMTILELEQEEPERRQTVTLETSILFRALAISGVVFNHAELMPSQYIQGGAFLLLMISGSNFARFQGGSLLQGRFTNTISSLLGNLLIPYLSIALAYQVYTQEFNLPVLLFVSNFVGPGTASIFPIWFIQVLTQCIILFSLLFSIRSIRNFANVSPWRFGFITLMISIAIRLLVPYLWDTNYLFNRVPHMMIWLFILGWCIQFAGRCTSMVG